jgi:hypothetical protein
VFAIIFDKVIRHGLAMPFFEPESGFFDFCDERAGCVVCGLVWAPK